MTEIDGKALEAVKLYSPYCDSLGQHAGMVWSTEGEYVRYTDYAALQAERDELDALLNEGGSWEQQLSKAEARAEAAEKRLNTLWDALSWLDTFSPEDTAAIEAKFKLDIRTRNSGDSNA